MVGSLPDAVNIFANWANQKSAHYLVGLDGQLVQMVDERDAVYRSPFRPIGSQLRPARLAAQGIDAPEEPSPVAKKQVVFVNHNRRVANPYMVAEGRFPDESAGDGLERVQHPTCLSVEQSVRLSKLTKG